MITGFTIAAVLAAACIVPMLLVIHTRNDLRFLRGTSFIAIVLASTVAGASSLALLSWPTAPIVGVTLPRDATIDVVGYRLFPGERMVLLLDLPEGPRLYEYPWDKKKAQQMEEEIEKGSKLQVSTFDKKDGKGNKVDRGIVSASTPSDITASDPSVVGLPPKEAEHTRLFDVGG